MDEHRFPCLFLKLDESDPADFRFGFTDDNGLVARFMIEFVDGGKVWFPTVEDGTQFALIHGLQPVDDATMKNLRGEHRKEPL
jgi:hypothetical protein